MCSERTLEEKQIARRIISLKNKQYKYRKKYLDWDAEISVLKAKLNECSAKRMNNRRKPKRGDFYND